MKWLLTMLLILPILVFCQQSTSSAPKVFMKDSFTKTIKKDAHVIIQAKRTETMEENSKEAQRDWFDIVAAIANVATAGAFIALILKERKTRKDVQDLKVVASAIGEQNRLLNAQLKKAFKPNFVLERKASNDIEFTLTNTGEKAIITGLEHIKTNIIWENENLPPIELLKDKSVVFKCKYKSGPVIFVGLLNVHYYDSLGNLYFLGVWLKDNEFELFYQETMDLSDTLQKMVDSSYTVKRKKFDEDAAKRMEEFEVKYNIE